MNIYSPTSQTEPPQDTSTPKQYKPVFTGSASEYFRIWIVNIFLTIVTLGIYAAWAKVRTRRYFYAHTKLANHPFDYLANPVAILKGNLIIAGGIILYNSSQVIGSKWTNIITIAFSLIIPFLIFKSLRFYAYNSAFKNIRFHFIGTMKDSYLIYLLLPICIPFTLGLIFPYWVYLRKNYFFENFAFGATTNTFTGEPRPFYLTYLKASLMFIGAAIIIIGFILSFCLSSISYIFKGTAPQALGNFKPWIMIFLSLLLIYLFLLFLFTGIQQYIYSRITNYCWRHSKLGEVRFLSTIQARQLLWIRLTNILIIILSLGLLAPWAKIRRVRYILDNIKVITTGDLNDFVAAVGSDESAYGDAATDFFDFEIGL